MAIGTMTKVAGAGANPLSPAFMDQVSFAGLSSYATGGMAGFKTALQTLTNDSREPLAVVSLLGEYQVEYDSDNDKLKVFTGGSEVSNATNLSSVTFKVLVLSK